MNITLLSGGVGGARCALAFDTWRRTVDPTLSLTAIVNTGDDFTHLGLRVAPDIDSVTYHLAGLADLARGWGRADDTTRIADQVARHLPAAAWFHLSDNDLGHSLLRTEMLASGLTLSEVTDRFARDFGVTARIIPVTDDASPTIVQLPGGELPFQEWWVREQASPVPTGFDFPLAAAARPAPGVIEAISSADLVVIAPSNPVVSITPILNIPGVRDAVLSTAAPVIGLSPIIGGRPVRGWADRCLAAAGVECSASAVRDVYGSRSVGGLLDGWLVDTADAAAAGVGTGSSGPVGTIPTLATPLLFTGSDQDNKIIEAVLSLA